jgi:hypothetical protein
MDWVWNHSRSKGVGRMVMLALADKALPATADCRAYGSYRFLAQRANCTQGAITEALDGLYSLGELELLPEKGPMGAATYRLPKAVGHTRPVRGNRSAHPSDSDAKARKESLGSAEQQVHGSAVRSEAESLGSADHNTTTPPKTTTSAPTDPPASGDTKGGGGGDQQQEAEAFLQSLPSPWTAGRKTARELAPLLLERTGEQGWQLDADLAAQLSKNATGVNHPASVLRARIDDLPKKPTAKTRASPSLPPWCGQCGDKDPAAETDAARRFHHLNDGSSQRCHCHPAHQKAA